MLFHIWVVLSILLSLICNGVAAGVTSAFIRSEWPSVDIPLDNQVFKVPEGYNAPQQVSLSSFLPTIFNIIICQ